ncbi:MAG: ChaN family lipoprotein, partial [Deltaproteobacteria bacterium]|nr:ChaN family lipoprotein [Deltaproteobacteria bacterium]
MPTFTLLGRQVLKLPFIPETSLGHEILHSWFGNSIYVDPRQGNWSEGLTTYLADHHYKQIKGEGWQYRRKLLEDFESYVRPGNEITVRDFQGSNDRAVRAVGYGKAAMIFHMMKSRIGGQAFLRGLRMLVARKSFQLTTWKDMVTIFSEASGQDLHEFFRFWLSTKGMINLKMNGVNLYHSREGYSLELRIRIQNSILPLAVPLTLLFNDRTERSTILLEDFEQMITLKRGERPLKIILDPDYDLFRSLSRAEKRPLLSRLLGDPNRKVVLPEEQEHVYEALVEELKKRGFSVVDPGDFSHKELTKGSVLFLGPQKEFGSLFPPKQGQESGFSLRVRMNPFDSEGVLGLALAKDPGEVSLVITKLFHYGGYSMVEFEKGRIKEKVSPKASRGIRFDVPPPVTGIEMKSLLPLNEIISKAALSKVVFVGEKHDRYGDHLVQLEVIRGLRQLYPKLAIGMEMFQRPYQEALDRYVSGTIDEETFLRESRYFSTWRYNYNLYRDILQYARRERIPVIALNQDNELVSRVAEVGLEKLGREERARIPEELAFEDASYEERLRKAFDMHQVELPGGQAPKVFEYFHQAQNVRDETMAETIAEFLTKNPDYRVVVLAGNGHLEYGSGIPSRVHRRLGIKHAIILPDPGGSLEVAIADFIVFPGKAKVSPPPKLGISVDTTGGTLEVKGFSHGSSAKEAGMEEGDVIMAVDNRPVKDIAELKASLAVRRIGDIVTITIQRRKEKLDLQVKLAK